MLVSPRFIGVFRVCYAAGGAVVSFGRPWVSANYKHPCIAGIDPIPARRIEDMAAKRIRSDVYVRPTAFTVAPEHIEKLEAMKGETGLSRSEIVRRLIEAATPEAVEQPAA